MHNLRTALLVSIPAALIITNFALADQAAIDACAGVTSGIRCLQSGSKFVNCNGDRLVSQPVAAGQICKDNQVIAASFNGNGLGALLRSLGAAGRSAHSTRASSAASTPAPTTSAPTSSPASTKPNAAQSTSSKAPDPCFLGGQVLASDAQDDSCTGKDGSIECRTEYMYVRCNVGKLTRCRPDKGKKCENNKLSGTYQA